MGGAPPEDSNPLSSEMGTELEPPLAIFPKAAASISVDFCWRSMSSTRTSTSRLEPVLLDLVEEFRYFGWNPRSGRSDELRGLIGERLASSKETRFLLLDLCEPDLAFPERLGW